MTDSSSLLCVLCDSEGASHRDDWGRVICGSCAHVRRERGLDGPGRDACPIRENIIGVGENGRTPEGAEPWYWRPPKAERDDHHDEVYVLNGSALYRQSSPVHVRGARYKAPADTWDSTGRVDAEAYEAVLSLLTPSERKAYEGRHRDGLSRATIAEVLGISERAVKRTLERATAKIRREVPLL